MSVDPTRPDRLETGVPGLDEVLLGGYLSGGLHLVVGPPGVGKTILASQIAFHHARRGGKVIYVTVLTEPHARMLVHLRGMSFFEERLIPDGIYFVSAYRELEKGGLPALLDLVKAVVHERKASVLVIDGALVAELQSSPKDQQRFVYELNAHLITDGTSGLLLSTGARRVTEEAMVESVTVLEQRQIALRTLGELRVAKMRGGEFLGGAHQFTIDSHGVTVLPRTEAVAARRVFRATAQTRVAPEKLPGPSRAAFGVAALDAMLRGGLPAGSTTTLLGAPGSGKTLLASTFLAHGARAGERGLYFGFSESPRGLVSKAAGVGLDLATHVREGVLALSWQPPVEELLDSVAIRLLDGVRRQRARRVVVDGFDGFRQVAADPERLPAFFVALSEELRGAGVTALFTDETDLFRSDVLVPEGLATTVDNIIFLRYVELAAQLRRLLSIVKLRESGYDTSLREFRITDSGFAIEATFASAEMVMTGVAREAPGAALPRRAPTRGKGRRTRKRGGT